ncbi:hypothetical protein DB43_GQ00030 [Parachlamydia acanthamoebae]|uniref:Uncharacterized protein n=1 Tax=Parachlamydia acanthamoebae TaxID=83552 RepID=A0A0C1C0T2_9BACT|nr:hypothetical protein DB43_GQ00030 [Parachlamydia acanthamoebae]
MCLRIWVSLLCHSLSRIEGSFMRCCLARIVFLLIVQVGIRWLVMMSCWVIPLMRNHLLILAIKALLLIWIRGVFTSLILRMV